MTRLLVGLGILFATLIIDPSATKVHAAPRITSISPETVEPGEVVYVYGTNFDQDTYVTLDGTYGLTIEPASITLISDTALSFTLPSSVEIGAHTLSLAEKGSQLSISSRMTFEVADNTPEEPVATDPQTASSAPATPATPAEEQETIKQLQILLKSLLEQLITLLQQQATAQR